MMPVDQPLSSSEKLMLHNLLARARVTEEEPDAATLHSFDFIEEDLQAMNDASKRRMSEPAEGDGHRRVYTPEPIAEVLAYTARGKPGVDSMKSWGGSSFSLVSSLPRRAVWR